MHIRRVWDLGAFLMDSGQEGSGSDGASVGRRTLIPPRHVPHQVDADAVTVICERLRVALARKADELHPPSVTAPGAAHEGTRRLKTAIRLGDVDLTHNELVSGKALGLKVRLGYDVQCWGGARGRWRNTLSLMEFEFGEFVLNEH